jgi:hypothetical protein
MTRDLSYKQYWNMRPSEFRDGDRVSVKLVLVLGHGADYAIYAGTTDMTDDEVARHGDKVVDVQKNHRVGAVLFPQAIHGRFSR